MISENYTEAKLLTLKQKLFYFDINISWVYTITKRVFMNNVENGGV